MPDSIVTIIEETSLIRDLAANDIFFGFANKFTAPLKSLPDNFEVTDKILSDFEKFLEEKEYHIHTPAMSRIDDLIEMLEKEKIDGNVKDKLRNIQKDVKAEEKSLIRKQKSDIFRVLKFEILRRFKTQHEIISYSLKFDEYVNTAINLLYPKSYRKILAIEEQKEKNRY